MSNGVVFAVAGSKGGVGKTTTSINLSAVLAEEGYDVVLVEVDLAMANVGDFLDIDVGLEGEDPTLHEVLAGTATVVDATYDSPCAFDVVPSGASLRGYGDADVGGLSEVLATLRFAYDVVVLDTGAGVTVETVLPLALADETILVSSPRVASVRDTMKTRDLTRQVGGSVAGVVFVRSGTGRSPDVDHIADFLSVDLLGHVPEDSAVPNAQDVGLPVVVAESESRAAVGYRALGDRLRERIDALDAQSAGTLSAESLDRGGSGFAFVDRPTDGDGDDEGGNEGDDVDEGWDEADGQDRRAASVVTRTTNGRADGPTRNGTDGAAREGADGTRSQAPTKGTGSGTRATSNEELDGHTDGSTGARVDESDTTGRADVESRPDGADVLDEAGTTDSADVLDGERAGDAAETTDDTGADETEATDASEDVDDGSSDGAESTEPISETGGTDGSNDSEATDGTPDADDTGAADSAETLDAETGDDKRRAEDADRAHADTEGSTSSTTKRFIDRARALVDRRND